MATTKDLFETISARASTQWGDNWRAELAKATIEIIARTDPEATYEKRRKQIYRALEEQSCNASTLLALIEAVGCRLQLICTTIEKIDL